MMLPKYLQDKCDGPEVSMGLQHARIFTAKGEFMCHINGGREIGYVAGYDVIPFAVSDIINLVITTDKIDRSKYQDYLDNLKKQKI